MEKAFIEINYKMRKIEREKNIIIKGIKIHTDDSTPLQQQENRDVCEWRDVREKDAHVTAEETHLSLGRLPSRP